VTLLNTATLKQKQNVHEHTPAHDHTWKCKASQTHFQQKQTKEGSEFIRLIQNKPKALSSAGREIKVWLVIQIYSISNQQK